MQPAAIIELFSERWALELAFFHAQGKLGFQDPQHRTEHAVAGTAPRALWLCSLVVLWYLRTGQHLRSARLGACPWYTSKLCRRSATGWLLGGVLPGSSDFLSHAPTCRPCEKESALSSNPLPPETSRAFNSFPILTSAPRPGRERARHGHIEFTRYTRVADSLSSGRARPQAANQSPQGLGGRANRDDAVRREDLHVLIASCSPGRGGIPRS